MLIDIYLKFREDSLNGFQVIERKQFCDRQTDSRGKNNMCPCPKGRRHKYKQRIATKETHRIGQQKNKTAGVRVMWGSGRGGEDGGVA